MQTVHVYVVAVPDELVVRLVGMNWFVSVRRGDVLEEIALELFAEFFDMLPGVLPELLHIPLVALAPEVALEAVLIAALLLAHLHIIRVVHGCDLSHSSRAFPQAR